MADFNHAVQEHSKHSELMTQAIKHAIINRQVSHLTFPDEIQVTAKPENEEAQTPEGRITPFTITPPEEMVDIPRAPGSLAEALDHFEKDHDFLLKGDVFTPDLIDMWISYKRENEVDALRLRPHPYEFFMYYDL